MDAQDKDPSGREDAPEAAGAGRWLFASRVAVQLSQLVIFLVAARFLTPAEFGVFALVQAFSVLLFIVGAAGWREFVMSWTGEERGIDQAICYALAGGAVMFAAGAGLAAGLYWIVDAPVAGALLFIFSGCVQLAPVASAYSGVLVRRRRIAGLAAATIIAEAAGLAAAVAALFAGWGVFALAAGKLVVQLVMVAVVIALARRPFRLVVRAGHGRAILSMSGQILANRIIGFAQSNGATFIIGAVLGAAAVGLFRAAERLVSAVAELVMEPLRLIAWVQFRQAAARGAATGDATGALAAEAGRVTPLFFVLAAPVFVGLALVSPMLVAVLLGDVWLEAGPVASILAVGALAAILNTTTEPLLSLAGRIRALPPVLLFNAAIAMTALVALGQFGLLAAAAANPVAGVVAITAIALLQKRCVGVNWKEALARAAPIAPALAALIAVVLGVRALIAPTGLAPIFALGLEAAAGALAYAGVLGAIRFRLLRSALALV